MNELQARSSSEEAAFWLAVLRRGVMTLDERSAYQAWRQHGRNAVAMAEMERLWRSLDIAQNNYAERQTEIMPIRRRGNAARSTLVAAMCVVSLGIGVLSYSSESGFWTNLDWTDR